MFTSMDSLGERIEDIGDKLQGMARTYTASDEQGVHVSARFPGPPSEEHHRSVRLYTAVRTAMRTAA